MTPKQQYEADALCWQQAGRDAAQLLQTRWDVLALACWVNSKGAEADGVSQQLRDFLDACEARLRRISPGWYDDVLCERGHCARCGESWRIENLAVCTHCEYTYCFRCDDFPLAENGNPQHHCGGELVG